MDEELRGFRIDVWPRSRIRINGVILRGDPDGRQMPRDEGEWCDALGKKGLHPPFNRRGRESS